MTETQFHKLRWIEVCRVLVLAAVSLSGIFFFEPGEIQLAVTIIPLFLLPTLRELKVIYLSYEDFKKEDVLSPPLQRTSRESVQAWSVVTKFLVLVAIALLIVVFAVIGRTHWFFLVMAGLAAVGFFGLMYLMLSNDQEEVRQPRNR